jgi:hypothetical protein
MKQEKTGVQLVRGNSRRAQLMRSALMQKPCKYADIPIGTRCAGGRSYGHVRRAVRRALVRPKTIKNIFMKNLMRVAVLGLACVACLGVMDLSAQAQGNNRGNYDPAQMKQERLDRYKESLEIKDDAEWKAIQPLVEKVMDAQQAVLRDRLSGMFGRSRRSSSGSSSSSSDSSSSRRSRGGFGGEPSPEAQALQRAIDGKASNSEMKIAIARFQDARKQKLADMEAAQANLKKVLSVRQEAIATESGLL